jgi:hypothetical protein
VEHSTLFRYQTDGSEKWLYNITGANPLTTAEANTQIDACVLYKPIQKVEYIRHWVTIDETQHNTINQKASSGFWKSSITWRTKIKTGAPKQSGLVAHTTPEVHIQTTTGSQLPNVKSNK